MSGRDPDIEAILQDQSQRGLYGNIYELANLAQKTRDELAAMHTMHHAVLEMLKERDIALSDSFEVLKDACDTLDSTRAVLRSVIRSFQNNVGVFPQNQLSLEQFVVLTAAREFLQSNTVEKRESTCPCWDYIPKPQLDCLCVCCVIVPKSETCDELLNCECRTPDRRPLLSER